MRALRAVHHLDAAAGSQPQAAPHRARDDAHGAERCTSAASSPTCVPTRVVLSEQAITAARRMCTRLYGAEYLPETPRRYATKARNAQEAHEAIRPAGESFRTPKETGLDGSELALYDLIWKRTVACQMTDARQTALAVDDRGGERDLPGQRQAHRLPRLPPRLRRGHRRSRGGARGPGDRRCPRSRSATRPNCTDLEAVGHETQAARALHRSRAGQDARRRRASAARPPTPASSAPSSIAATCARRARRWCRPSPPSPSRRCSSSHFADARGHQVHREDGAHARRDRRRAQQSRLAYLSEFYLGDERPAAGQVEGASAHRARPRRARSRSKVSTPTVRIGRFGPYVERGAATASARLAAQGCRARRSRPGAQSRRSCASEPKGRRSAGQPPGDRRAIYVIDGQYGPYVQLGRQVTKEASQAEARVAAQGREARGCHARARPRPARAAALLGEHPESRRPVQAGLGRFGPYVVHDNGKGGKEFRSLKAGDDVLTVQLDARAGAAGPAEGGRGAAAPAPRRSARSARIPKDEQAGAAVRWPVRPLREARRGQRLAAEGHRSRDLRARRRRWSCSPTKAASAKGEARRAGNAALRHEPRAAKAHRATVVGGGLAGV